MVLGERDLLFRFRSIRHTLQWQKFNNQEEAEQKMPLAKYYHPAASRSLTSIDDLRMSYACVGMDQVSLEHALILRIPIAKWDTTFLT